LVLEPRDVPDRLCGNQVLLLDEELLLSRVEVVELGQFEARIEAEPFRVGPVGVDTHGRRAMHRVSRPRDHDHAVFANRPLGARQVAVEPEAVGWCRESR